MGYNISMSNPEIVSRHLPLMYQLKSEIKHEDGTILMPFVPMADYPNSRGLIGHYESWFNDPDVIKYLRKNTPFTTDPDTQVSCGEFQRHMANDPFQAYYSIFPDNRSKAVGHVSLNGIDYDKLSFSIGVVIGEKEWWNKGLASKVVNMVISRAQELGFRIAKADCYENNIASVRLLEKIFGPGKSDGQCVYFEKNLQDQ